MTCYIIEDEPLAIDLLREYIGQVDSLDLLGHERNPVLGLKAVQELVPDVLFLDINMPKLSGLELAEHLPSTTALVFTTAYEEHALQGYELNAVDYLLKPFHLSRFIKCVAKLKVFTSTSRTEKPPQNLLIKDGHKQHRVDSNDLRYVKADQGYLEFIFTNTRLVVLGTLREEETRLKPYGFLRIHKSYVVNVNRITSFATNHVKVDGENLPIGRSFKAEVKQALAKT